MKGLMWGVAGTDGAMCAALNKIEAVVKLVYCLACHSLNAEHKTLCALCEY